jgi:hypothetical protein
MHLDDIQDLLHRRPFLPLRLVTTDGRTFVIRHPELCMPGTRHVIIGFPPPGGDTDPPAFERFVLIDRSHVVSMEPIEEPTAAPGP